MGEKHIVFQIGEGNFSIPLEEVSQIIRLENVVDVPAAPPFVDGVMNVGGEVVPVVNLRARLSLERLEVTRRNRVIILQKQDIRYGILVDAVREILDLEPDRIAVEAASVFGIKSEFVRGIAKIRDYLLVLLDIFKVLSVSPEVSIRE
jgi:purine-binding chemotaxis protein CheW